MTTKRGARTPRDLLASYVERVAAGDVAGIVGSYAADAVVTLPCGREAAGLEAIGVAFAGALASGAALAVDDSVVDEARVIETGSLSMVSFTGLDGAVRTLVAWRAEDGWAWVRDGSMLRDVEAALGAGLVDVA
ncbi:MAG TPA: nuclear transport factor 2 family protein [Intrasporangium sp.]|uniref:nuclear transport factor 2 family protein n=1 Tax=Intrasporangium sp. TaxID=1925024 RepID=UPI002B48767D|nr:nuclear transport factor 2 family protein [Intrasporangium sp.]HKX67647.1 nuclear transport factor 2 family protein [Intrasporangium sp.]